MISVECLEKIRARRNRDLSASDWTQARDLPAEIALPAETVEAWATYRQALRDYPAAVVASIEPVKYPTKPTQ